MEVIQQIQKRYFSKSRPPAWQHSKNLKNVRREIEATRRAMLTNSEIVNCPKNEIRNSDTRTMICQRSYSNIEFRTPKYNSYINKYNPSFKLNDSRGNFFCFQTDERTGGRSDRRAEERAVGRKGGRSGGRTAGRADGRKGGRAGGRSDRRTGELHSHLTNKGNLYEKQVNAYGGEARLRLSHAHVSVQRVLLENGSGRTEIVCWTG